jgi:TonB family protein
MRNIVIAAYWIALVLPVAVRAMDADYPAIGIKVTSLPASATSLGVSEQFKGYQAEVLLGPGAMIRMLRLDGPAPEGNMEDKGYRDALLKQFDIPTAGGGIHGVTNVSGRLAWVWSSVARIGPMLAYRCNYYLVIDQHLDEIMITAAGRAKAAQATFDAAAKVIASGLVFEAAQRPPERALAPGELPPFLVGGAGAPPYSDRARRLGEQGEVHLEFNIDGVGKAQAVKVVDNAGPDLASVALTMLKRGSFKVPQTWEQIGGPKETFRMEFRFRLSCPLVRPSLEQPDPHVVTICASLLAH